MTFQSSRSAQPSFTPASSPVTGFPQVGLQQALESAFALYAARQSTRWIDEGRFRRLLGHDRQSGQLVRLTLGMKLYGLINSRKNAYALTEGAMKLFSSADQGEFRALVYDAALLPQGVRELANTYSASLDSRELETELRGRRIAEQDRALILKVLRENGEFVHREQELGELFRRFQSAAGGQTNHRALGWLQGVFRWMNTQPGRTANLALVAVMSVGSLAYVAFGFISPDGPTSRSAREVTAPVPVVRVPFSALAPAAASQGTGRQSQAGNVGRQPPALRTPALGQIALRQSGQDASQAARPSARPAPTAVRPAIVISEPVATKSAVALNQPLLTLARGRELAQMLFTQRLSGLWDAFSPSVRREWGEYPAFAAYRAGGLKTYGAETEVVAEDVRRSGPISYYVRTATFERGLRHNWTLILGLDPAGTVVAFNIVAADVLPGVTALARR